MEVEQWRSTMVDSGGVGEARAGAAVVVLGGRRAAVSTGFARVRGKPCL